MLTRRIIPCLDTRDGRVIKGRRFRDLRDVGDPVSLAARYDSEGADEIVLLDVSATADMRRHAVDTVTAVREVLTIPLTVGGGVRDRADAERLLDHGADKVAINTAAILDPGLIDLLAGRFGRQCVVVAIDVLWTDGAWMVRSHAGESPSTWPATAWAVEAAARGAGEILLTSIDRDGTGDGFDGALLRAVTATVDVPVIASGGARNPVELLLAVEAGADAVLAASIFHDQMATVGEVKRYLAAAGVEVRP
jgi:cyclase